MMKEIIKFSHCKLSIIYMIGWLVGIMVFNATFNNISKKLFRGSQLYWWRKPEEPAKATDLSQVIHKLYHIMLYTSS